MASESSSRIRAFFEELSYRWLVPLAALTALAPWPAGAEPHLWEKFNMLADGQLTRPLDIFDVFFHGTALVLLLVKVALDLSTGSSESDT
ncbi:RND transporter [Persicimonas caeni]|uniref:RND transporter n=1 Tax=Persicimonas caeni TaxID=2292766 RepID=A0A4Y6PPR0_PERCE|nr:RND transporter [Persicimonas caeni]QDG50308.1 RND transporter [Persicimonas caeni]QED31529.1 RND transporter [Persicimonas caeni]